MTDTGKNTITQPALHAADSTFATLRAQIPLLNLTFFKTVYLLAAVLNY